MRIAIRVDASIEIGTGHVMRCLTLAEALRSSGAMCQFISREHTGHLLDLIQQRGFQVNALQGGGGNDQRGRLLAHGAWLGATWEDDAKGTLLALGPTPVDWVVVDHYALDARWEGSLRRACRRLIVLDDLADRSHDCDMLLDQNLGCDATAYTSLIAAGCTVLSGPTYALLRPEFGALRLYSLERRASSALKHLLITMGGVDQGNAAGRVLQTLESCDLPSDCCISVVMGLRSQWLDDVTRQARRMPWKTQVLSNISNMAKLMAASDLAIGAAGGTSWERCCLGLPSLIVMLAANQRSGAQALQRAGAALVIGQVCDIKEHLSSTIEEVMAPNRLLNMSAAAAAVCEGLGAERVVKAMRVAHG
jgi:UDP-2,4-diacetamido-2,4,6-trideoxy-beta-L-altropyranose hydrolase